MAHQPNRPSTDEPLLAPDEVTDTAEESQAFDTYQFVEKLVRELGLPAELAGKIGLEVSQIVVEVGLRRFCPSLLEGLIDIKLLEYGLEREYRARTQIGLPLGEVERLVQQLDHQDARAALNPRETSLMLAESVKREYALRAVFSQPIAQAHLTGDFHIEKIEGIDCLYSLCLSPDYLKRVGALVPPGGMRPPRQAEEFVFYLVQSSMALQQCLSGPLCWDSFNYTFAPLIANWSKTDIYMLAETLLQQFNLLGGECLLFLDWQAPDYLADRPALAIDGSELPGSYQSYSESARLLLIALLELYLSGDHIGLPLINPRPVIFFRLAQSHMEFPADAETCFELLGRLARERGQFEVRYIRGKHDGFAERYGIAPSASTQSGNWGGRTGVFQVISVNLPRAALRAG
ncbi:MAG: anaerobic ribonucleoside-triphosphate reductase, partial [Acidobacteriota bacterium]